MTERNVELLAGKICAGQPNGWVLIGGDCSQLAYFCERGVNGEDEPDMKCRGHEIVDSTSFNQCVRSNEVPACAGVKKTDTSL